MQGLQPWAGTTLGTSTAQPCSARLSPEPLLGQLEEDPCGSLPGQMFCESDRLSVCVHN